MPKIIIVLLGLLNGCWMIFDGIHVRLKGKYFGPEKPGPWSNLISAIGLDPLKIGPFFIAAGIFWLIFTIALVSHQLWSRNLGIIICIITVWYFPAGTLVSAAVFFLLAIYKQALL